MLWAAVRRMLGELCWLALVDHRIISIALSHATLEVTPAMFDAAWQYRSSREDTVLVSQCVLRGVQDDH